MHAFSKLVSVWILRFLMFLSLEPVFWPEQDLLDLFTVEFSTSLLVLFFLSLL